MGAGDDPEIEATVEEETFEALHDGSGEPEEPAAGSKPSATKAAKAKDETAKAEKAKA
jgi:hypothetical protein